jgi:addiction module HigA family antidote
LTSEFLLGTVWKNSKGIVKVNTVFGSTISGECVSAGETATHMKWNYRIIMFKEFLEPMGISQYRLAKEISVPARRINEIVHGNRAIKADTALRLSRYFGTSERFG